MSLASSARTRGADSGIRRLCEGAKRAAEAYRDLSCDAHLRPGVKSGLI